MRRSIHSAAVATIAMVALAGCSSAADKAASSSSASSTSTTAADRGADVMFAQMMIPHHQQAVQMSDMALASTAGASAQVKALAGRIKKAQAPEIATMRGWLKNWGATMPEGTVMHHGSHMMSDTDMKALKPLRGKGFDRKWLTMMIAHHQGAMQMAQDVLKTSKDAQVRKLATSIVSGQTAEIKTMQGLL